MAITINWEYNRQRTNKHPHDMKKNSFVASKYDITQFFIFGKKKQNFIKSRKALQRVDKDRQIQHYRRNP